MTRDGEGQGHYIRDVKCSQKQQWFRTNDNEDPVPIEVDDVSKHGVVILYNMVHQANRCSEHHALSYLLNPFGKV